MQHILHISLLSWTLAKSDYRMLFHHYFEIKFYQSIEKMSSQVGHNNHISLLSWTLAKSDYRMSFHHYFEIKFYQSIEKMSSQVGHNNNTMF